MQERKQTISSKKVVEGKSRLHSEITSSKGRDILDDPLFNKSLAFPRTERDRMGLRGLLPAPVIRTMNEQERIVMDELSHSWSERKDDMIQNDEMVLKSGIMKEDVRKKEVLMGLHERNETLYYKIIMDFFKEMSKIIYTPTVGWACARYSGLYKKPRGMFFSLKDKGEFASMVFNWDSDKVDVVVTDGSRVLGLGDLGIGGLGISIGKLDLYIAAGGFHPRRVLPVVIDIGTDNPGLRNDPNYMGLINPRIDGWEYYEIIDEFMEAIALRWPKALVQFEDFQTKHAIKLLQRYKNSFLMFNDDIQVSLVNFVNSGLYLILPGYGSHCAGRLVRRHEAAGEALLRVGQREDRPGGGGQCRHWSGSHYQEGHGNQDGSDDGGGFREVLHLG